VNLLPDVESWAGVLSWLAWTASQSIRQYKSIITSFWKRDCEVFFLKGGKRRGEDSTVAIK